MATKTATEVKHHFPQVRAVVHKGLCLRSEHTTMGEDGIELGIKHEVELFIAGNAACKARVESLGAIPDSEWEAFAEELAQKLKGRMQG